MKKWITCCLLSIVMLIFLPNSALAASESVWDASVASGFEMGDGSEQSPYLIQSAEELAYLSRSVASGVSYEGEFFQLETDIDLNNLEWTPIGTDNHSFDGTFLGGNHTIRNLSIRKHSVYMGLFGCCRGEIRDLRIESCSISTTMYTGNSYAGALVGYNYANIINCHSSGSIKVVYSSGGANIAGGLLADNCGSVLYCSSSCTVTIIGGGSYNGNAAGGLIGSQVGYGTVAASFATGDVTADTTSADYMAYADAGGLVGDCYSNDCTIANCYATGDVSAAARYSASAGGLVDSARCPVVNCFATGNVSSSHRAYDLFSPYIEGKAINCYVSSRQTATSETPNVIKVDPENFRDADWISEHLWIDGDGTWSAENGLPEWTPDRIKTIEINNADDLIALSGKALVGSYILTADIDLEGVEWEPILLNAGVFDGNGHVIRGLTLSGACYDGGLFGKNSGTIQRLGMEDCNIDIYCSTVETYVSAGAIAGRNYNLIRDCYATGNITARNQNTVEGMSYRENSYAGGICGSNGMATVERCYVDVSVRATSNLDTPFAGGIAGVNTYGEVISCFVMGSVVSGKSGGAVTGSGGTVTKCYASNQQSVSINSSASVPKIVQSNFQSQTWIAETLGWDTEDIWIVDGDFPKLRNDDPPPVSPPAYRIDSLRVRNDQGEYLDEVPIGRFWTEVSVTKLWEDEDALVFLAAYEEDGTFRGLMYVSLTGLQFNASAKVGLPMENTDGTIKTIKAFVISSFQEMKPLSDPLCIGKEV